MNAARREMTLRHERIRLFKFEYANEILNVFKLFRGVRARVTRKRPSNPTNRHSDSGFPSVYLFVYLLFFVLVFVLVVAGSCSMTKKNLPVAASCKRPRRISFPRKFENSKIRKFENSKIRKFPFLLLLLC